MLSFVAPLVPSGRSGDPAEPASAYTDGFQNPVRPPAYWSITAADPASCGATKLVPPQPPCSAGEASGSYSTYPVNRSASPETSRLPPPVPRPLLTPPPAAP